VQSMEMVLNYLDAPRMRRVFHGVYFQGRDLQYYKPSSNKTGPAWKRSYPDPKSGRTMFYKLYGGKLAGILTQSLCREIFFQHLLDLDYMLSKEEGVRMVGQFHDEVIVEYDGTKSCTMTPSDVTNLLTMVMRKSDLVPKLPMAVEVKHARSYIK